MALVGLTALLDNLIFHRDPDAAYLDVLAHSISKIQTPSALQAVDEHPDLMVEIIPVSEMYFNLEQTNTLNNGGFIIAYSQDDQPFIYSKLDSNDVVRVSVTSNQRAKEGFIWYRIAFFTALALLVALWSWPIWRDIKKLERGAKSVQPDGSIQAIAVGASSSLNVIASALQSLSERVRNLLNNQRELTSAVAHEFRTPLARLKFSIESMNDSSVKKSVSEDIRELENLIQEMLEFSQSQHHAPELSFAEIPVADMVDSLIAALPATKTEQIQIVNQCEPVILHADGHFVERAITNLLNNAVKFAQQRIVLTTLEEPNHIIIYVEDDGPGVAPQLREKIFDAFYRPDQSRTRHQGGAGLGLATVKKIQEWHQGEIWVEESAIGGARFVLKYPTSL